MIAPGLGRASQTLDSLTARIIDTRIREPHDEPIDLLDLLSTGQDGQPLSRAEIRDEVMTLVIAGHETTTSALTFMLPLLSQIPAAYERLIVEVDDVLRGRDPAAADVEVLPWTQAVVSEALRLYPPACYINRDAAQEDDLLGIPVSAGDTVGLSPYHCTVIPNSGQSQSDSNLNDSSRRTRPPARAMRMSRSAPVVTCVWARDWPSWS